jgi:16S rRNA (cytosine1402-N4)-methyltransferase
VLQNAVLESLAPQRGGIFVDATFGRGGHAARLLGRLPGGRLYAFDRDPAACTEGRRRFAGDGRFSVAQRPFSRLREELADQGALGRVDGLLFDLGVSSPQVDDPRRGFSFRRDGPLDMRMDPDHGESAARWLARAGEGEIARVLWQLGEERHARRIAGAIVRARARSPIETTARLAGIVRGAMPRPVRPQRIDPATRTFQAVRIFINGELEELRGVLPQTLDILAPGGRLTVIAFHSLEDRIVKRFLRDQARPAPDPLSLAEPAAPRLKLLGKPVRADGREIEENPRARSAILRTAERLREGER